MFVFLFKQKTAYEMSISDWSSDVCSSDLGGDDVVLALDDRVDVLPDARGHLGHACDVIGVNGHVCPPRVQSSASTVTRDRKSVVSGQSVSVRVDLVCSRTL